MRILIAALLLTTAATPALAAPDNRDGRDSRRTELLERLAGARQERAERREERREQTVERVRSVRNEAAGDNGVLRQGQRSEDAGAARITRAERQPLSREQRQQRRADRVRPGAAPDSVAGWRAGERRRGDRPVLTTGPAPVVQRSVSQPPVRVVPRGGIQGQVANSLQRSGVAAALANPEFARRWREDWRRDDRHDWRRYRDQNRSLFRFGYYHDPYGYSYRRFGLGYQMVPSYYGSRYWLNDPWQYRLPYAGGSYRWVRYWDDAVLVDLRTGRVVDVIYDFFW